ncbi:MAG: hypothetical protein JXQ76_07500 [Campylobacterales bacterium]|nr:hypothetical protein [Campylobacterales bacterium]
MKKDKEEPFLLHRFKSRGFGNRSYSNAHSINQSILSKVLSGKLKGTNKTKAGATRKVIVQLKKDGVWTSALPWEEKN